ncbi:MAG TPA: ATP-binding protein [Tepidisphaeraceae bacterium]|jgi:C4-dicarboxylate-specific signal transduction histidine kinase|nr:ATP-binding protein [Tepidisphaeraceae bacterium]
MAESAMPILLVEDSVADAATIRRALSDSTFGRFEVTVAKRLEEAAQNLAAATYAAVLLDLNLPDSAGLETLEHLRRLVPHVPVVVLTGLADEELAVAAVQKGAQDYLVKGRSAPEVIGRAVRYVIERAATDRNARALEADVAHLLRVSTMGQMASGLAHELNQPLAAIMNYASTCLAQLGSENRQNRIARQAIEELMNETRRAGSIISQMRRFVHRGEPRRMPIDLNLLVCESVKMVGFELQRHEVRPKISLCPGLPRTAADPIQIEQVMVNLIYNAVEAMDHLSANQKTLRIKTGLTDDCRSVEVSVSDTGKGISEKNLTRLFEPFFTTKETGMGMGLNISRSIVESFAGRLSASANPLGGMRFTFTLPIMESSDA